MSADFFDSNVFIYLFDGQAPAKQAVANALVRTALETKSACISFQVVQETLNVLTRKLAVPLTAPDAQAFLQQVLTPLWRVMPSAALYAHAVRLQGQIQLSFYDAVIVAAALEAGCKRLLTQDLQHGRRIEGLRIENPFKG